MQVSVALLQEIIIDEGDRSMRIAILMISLTLSAIILFGGSQIQAQELFDDNIITVEGQVVSGEIKEVNTQNVKDLVKFRQRRNSNNYQMPPPEGKQSFRLNVTARSYCIRGFTSRGAPTRFGVVAVDPCVIPFGSKLYIPGYGWGTALDTGGAIKGNSIDLWMPTYSQCMQWGVRKVTITVVKP